MKRRRRLLYNWGWISFSLKLRNHHYSEKNKHPLLQPLAKTHNLFHWVCILL
jgi:hypothetical protein